MSDWIRESNLIEGVDDPQEDQTCLAAWNWFLKQPLALDTIQKLHKKIMVRQLTGINLGRWRKYGVRVGPRVCPDWRLVPRMMWNWLFVFEKATSEDLIKQAHVAYEKVHPFVDGNGRTGRMIMNYQRVKAGLEPLCIEASKRWDYYKWFHEVELSVEKQMETAFLNHDMYSVQEDDVVWELYKGRTDFTHGFKIIQAHKKVSMPLGSLNLVPLTEYTPDSKESKEIIEALNGYPKLLAWKKKVLQAMEGYAIAHDTQTDEEAHNSYLELVKVTGIDEVFGFS